MGPGSGKNLFRIPDPRFKNKALDPRFGAATLAATFDCWRPHRKFRIKISAVQYSKRYRTLVLLQIDAVRQYC